MKNVPGVYMLQFPTGLYIGSSRHMRRRVLRHIADLKRGDHCNKFLQRAFEKYGEPEYFSLVQCLENDLIKFEQMLIDAFKPRFNLSPTAGRNLGHKHNAETLARMRESGRNAWKNRSRIMPEDVKRRISETTQGKVFSEETRKKISNACRGREVSFSTRIKLSIAKTGKPIKRRSHPNTPEILAKIAATKARKEMMKKWEFQETET